MRVTAKPLTGPLPSRIRMKAETMVVTWVSMMVIQSMVEAILDGYGGGLAVTDLFADALEDEDVGVDAHTDGEDDASDAGERQGGVREAHAAEQDDQVEEQGEVGVDARALVVDEHEDHDGGHAGDGCDDALTDARGAEGRADGAGFNVGDGGRKRAGAEEQGEVFCLLLGEAAGDLALVADAGLDGGDLANLVFQHDGHGAGGGAGGFVLVGVLEEAVAGLGGEGEGDVGAAVDVGGGLGVAEVGAFHFTGALEDVDAVGCAGRAYSANHVVVRREGSVDRGKGGGLVVEPGLAAVHGVDFELGGLLDDVFDAGGIVNAGEFDEDLVIAEAVLLDDGLGDAELVDALADGLDGGVEGAGLEVSDGRGAHGELESAVGLRGEIVAGVGGGADERADGAVLGRSDAGDGDGLRVRRIGLGDPGPGDAGCGERGLRGAGRHGPWRRRQLPPRGRRVRGGCRP